MLSVLSMLSFLCAGCLLWLSQRSMMPAIDTLMTMAALILWALSLAQAMWAAKQDRIHTKFLLHLVLALVGLCLLSIEGGGHGQLLVTVLAPWLQALGLCFLVYGLLPALSWAIALWRMRDAPMIEAQKLDFFCRTGRIMALSCITFAALNMASLNGNKKWDFSYFRTTQLSEATRAIAQGLTFEVCVELYFTAGNAVLEQVRSYTDALASQSPHIRIDVLDQALDGKRAQAHQVRSNGTIAVARAEKSQLVRLGTDVEQARAALRRLDDSIRLALLAVTLPEQMVYLSDGHGERGIAPKEGHQSVGVGDLTALMRKQNLVVRPLGLSEGLGNAIPEDAAMVAIVGPQKSFSAQEVQALRTYLDGGGRLLLSLDPDSQGEHETLAALAHVKLSRARVGNPHYQVRAQGSTANPFNMVTVRASGHPVVQSFEANPGRIGIVFLGASSIEPMAQTGCDVSWATLVQAMPDSFLDQNNNGRQDVNEKAWANIELATAVAWNPPHAPQEARVVIVGDADVFDDGILRNVGNSHLAAGAVQWLIDAPQMGRTTTHEEDVPLVHRKDQDVVWFYGVSFFVPMLVLAVGLWVARHNGRGRRPPPQPHL